MYNIISQPTSQVIDEVSARCKYQNLLLQLILKLIYTHYQHDQLLHVCWNRNGCSSTAFRRRHFICANYGKWTRCKCNLEEENNQKEIYNGNETVNISLLQILIRIWHTQCTLAVSSFDEEEYYTMIITKSNLIQIIVIIIYQLPQW